MRGSLELADLDPADSTDSPCLREKYSSFLVLLRRALLLWRSNFSHNCSMVVAVDQDREAIDKVEFVGA